MNVVLLSVWSEALVKKKRKEKNSWALLMEYFLLRREEISEWRAQRSAQDKNSEKLVQVEVVQLSPAKK